MGETKPELRMHGHYFGFCETGVPEIDRVLSAVACAGKSAHHTKYWNEEFWTDDDEGWTGHRGTSCQEMIQNAANDAADTWREAHAKVQAPSCE